MKMTNSRSCQAYVVRRDDAAGVVGRLETISLDELPAGDVLIHVDWSSLNYKDALAAKGHPGVARQLPHIPGIDAVGRVVASTSSEFAAGQAVLVTGYELGAGQWGGWSQRIRVPADWVVPLPENLSPRQAMVLGTAGFTAAQCVLRLEANGVLPSSGAILVSGATGGVGCIAVKLLSQLGYRVTASTGKLDQANWLLQLGAAAVINRSETLNSAERPMSGARWAGAVDTVGGETLASIIRSTDLNGCVAACGLVGGAPLPLTVYPFILRGVVLAGVSSQNCPMELRRHIWQLLATAWRLDALDEIAREIRLADVTPAIDQILSGQIRGRTIIRIPNEQA